VVRVPESSGFDGIYIVPPRYPKKGWDFPRREVEITPMEILSDNRVLSGMGRIVMMPTDQTILVQPRLETTLVRMVSI
jgi:hypothetical protein